MADVTAALRDRLKATAAITALVADRVYRGVRPQGSALPSISFRMISPGREYHHGGASDLADPRIQFDVWAASVGSASAVADALTLALEPTATQGDIFFDHAKLISRIDFDPEADANGTLIHQISMDFYVHHQPT